MRLSQTYADHSVELLTALNYLMGADGLPTADATRLGISADEVTNISVLRIAHETAYEKYSDINTHNTITVHAMKRADEDAYAVVLPLRQRLKNGVAELSDADYANLGIHEDKTTRSPAKIPEDVPMPALVKTQKRHLTFDAQEQTEEGANRIKLPKDCKVVRELAVLPQGQVPTEGDFHGIETVGRSRFTITFTAAEAGMDVHIRLAYENSAGRGAFSTPLLARII